MRNHLERNTCPKPLKYSARANTLADEQFKKYIKAIKQKAKRGFVEALTKGAFHLSELTGQDSPVVMKILLIIKAIQPDQSNPK